MKKLSAKRLTVIIVIAVLLVATLAVTLSLTMCRYEEPDLPSEEVISPYGNYDYSKKPYYSLQANHGVKIYKGNAYFLNGVTEIQYVSLNDLQKNMKEYRRTDTDKERENLAQTAQYVCPSLDHGHGTFTREKFDCPGYIGGDNMMFLLDNYESNGSFPVFYYSELTDLTVMAESEDKFAWHCRGTIRILRTASSEALTSPHLNAPMLCPIADSCSMPKKSLLSAIII